MAIVGVKGFSSPTTVREMAVWNV